VGGALFERAARIIVGAILRWKIGRRKFLLQACANFAAARSGVPGGGLQAPASLPRRRSTE